MVNEDGRSSIRTGTGNEFPEIIRRFVMALYFDGQKTLGLEQYDAVAYYRLSKDDGAKHESDSIANQRKVIRAFLQNNPNIHLVEEAQDDGYTGTNYDRPGFRSVLHAIQSKRVNCVIVKDISRLGRHFVMTSNYVERIFPEMGVRLICINDGYDSSAPDADSSALTLPLKMVMNDYYVKDISRKIRSSIHLSIIHI